MDLINRMSWFEISVGIIGVSNFAWYWIMSLFSTDTTPNRLAILNKSELMALVAFGFLAVTHELKKLRKKE